MRRLVQIVTELLWGSGRQDWHHDVEPDDVMPLEEFVGEARRRKASSVQIEVTRKPSSSEGYIKGTPYDFLAQYKAFGFNGARKLTRKPEFVDRIVYADESLTRTAPALVSDGSPILRLATYLENAATYCAQQGFETTYTNPFPALQDDPYTHDLANPFTRKVTTVEAFNKLRVDLHDLHLF